ncbi:hypothetical protein HYS93_00225 [Candidatus Daviesbacteria bacterium]|nr:hypothetical protein [Candidatus Daviesbacteria bacterium]
MSKRLVYFLFLLLVVISFLFTYPNNSSLASTTGCTTNTTTPRIDNGLATAGEFVSDEFGRGTNGRCIVDSLTKLDARKVEDFKYLSLLETNYNQIKSTNVKKVELTGDQTQAGFNLNDVNLKHLYHIKSGNLTISNTITSTFNQPLVIFVDGNLTFSANYTYGQNNKDQGTVFVVQGDVNIDPAITQIDGFIIANGVIRTAGATCTNSSVSAQALTINGSLASLGSTSIQFCRSLSNNDSAAEKIVFQPKYLAILKDIFGRVTNIFSEQ